MDDLIAAVPHRSVAFSCLAALSWFLVRSEGTGIAMRPREQGTVFHACHLAGMKTRDLVAWIKSWKPHKAALGLAAINSALNAPSGIERNCRQLLGSSGTENLFAYLLHQLRGKKVAVVGNFRDLERTAAVCDLTILERFSQPGDLPDTACEFVLPEHDVVMMTATILISKTLPRLLELSRHAKVVIAGPSTPLSPILFEHGVDVLGGLVAEDENMIWKCVNDGEQRGLFDNGSRCQISLPISLA